MQPFEHTNHFLRFYMNLLIVTKIIMILLDVKMLALTFPSEAVKIKAAFVHLIMNFSQIMKASSHLKIRILKLSFSTL